MKLARYLIRLTGRPEYGDGLERTLYNTMLATCLPTSDGDYPYYSDYGAGAEKRPHRHGRRHRMTFPLAEASSEWRPLIMIEKSAMPSPLVSASR